MSYFPSDDPERSRASMSEWQVYTTCPPQHTSSTQQTAHEPNYVNNTIWSVDGSSIPDPYTIPQPMPWTSEPPRGLGLESIYTPTQAMFDSNYSHSGDLPPSVSWNRPENSQPPSSAYQNGPQHCATLEQWYPSATSLTTSGAWDTIPAHTTAFTTSCDASPRRSNYSLSSSSSVVASSPYAHSEGCFQPASPPYIKQEENSERSNSRLYSVPGLASFNQPSHVNLGDIYTTPPLSAAEQASFSGFVEHPKIEPEDAKPVLWERESTPRRAISLEDMRSDSGDTRAKRGFTTQANSTCECEKCGKMFQRTYNLKAHMETHDPQREQPHECLYTGCKRRFVRRTDLVRHEQSVHLKTRNFHCPLCYSAFARKDTLRRHIDDGCPRREQVRRRDKTRLPPGVSDTSRLHPQPQQEAFMIPKTEPF